MVECPRSPGAGSTGSAIIDTLLLEGPKDEELVALGLLDARPSPPARGEALTLDTLELIAQAVGQMEGKVAQSVVCKASQLAGHGAALPPEAQVSQAADQEVGESMEGKPTQPGEGEEQAAELSEAEVRQSTEGKASQPEEHKEGESMQPIEGEGVLQSAEDDARELSSSKAGKPSQLAGCEVGQEVDNELGEPSCERLSQLMGKEVSGLARDNPIQIAEGHHEEKPVELAKAKPSQSADDKEDVQTVGSKSSQPTEGRGEFVEPVDGVEAFRPAEGGEAVEPLEGGEAVKPAEDREAVECAVGGEAAEPAESAERAEVVETAEAGSSQPTAGGEAAEPPEGGEPVKPAKGKAVEPADSGAAIKPAEGEAVKRAEAVEAIKLIENSEAIELVEGGEAIEPAEGEAVEPARVASKPGPSPGLEATAREASSIVAEAQAQWNPKGDSTRKRKRGAGTGSTSTLTVTLRSQVNDQPSTLDVDIRSRWRTFEPEGHMEDPNAIQKLLNTLPRMKVDTKDEGNCMVRRELGLQGADRLMEVASSIGSIESLMQLRDQVRLLSQEAPAGDVISLQPNQDMPSDLPPDHYDGSGGLTAAGRLVIIGRDIVRTEGAADNLRVRFRRNCVLLYDVWQEELERVQSGVSGLGRPRRPPARGLTVKTEVKDDLIKLLWPDRDLKQARVRFQHWVKVGKLLSPLVKKFGLGILALIPSSVSNRR